MIHYLKWIGTILSLAGALLVALHHVLPGYALFIAGSLAMLLAAKVQRDGAYLALNGAYLCINLLGVYNA